MAKRSFESYQRKSLRDRAAAGEVEVVVWEERDRLHIGIQEVDSGEYIAEWWDDDARSMFEDGFFKSGRGLKESVIDYAARMGLPAYKGAIKRSRR